MKMKLANTVYHAIAHANTSPLYGIHVSKLTSPLERNDSKVAPKASKCLEIDFDDCLTLIVPLRFVDPETNEIVEETDANDAISAILLGANVKACNINNVDTSVMIF